MAPRTLLLSYSDSSFTLFLIFQIFLTKGFKKKNQQKQKQPFLEQSFTAIKEFLKTIYLYRLARHNFYNAEDFFF